MSNCEKYETMISVLLDGELSAEESSELRAHLRECSACRELAEAMAVVSAELRNGLEPVPEGFAAGVMSRVYDECGISVVGGKKTRRFAFGRFTAIAAVLAVILFAAGGQLGGLYEKSAGVDTAQTIKSEADEDANSLPAEVADYAVVTGNDGAKPGEIAETEKPQAPPSPAEMFSPAPASPDEERSDTVPGTAESVYAVAGESDELPPAIPYDRTFYAILVARGGVPQELDGYTAEVGAESELLYIVPSSVVDAIYARLNESDLCSLHIGVDGYTDEAAKEGLVIVYS